VKDHHRKLRKDAKSNPNAHHSTFVVHTPAQASELVTLFYFFTPTGYSGAFSNNNISSTNTFILPSIHSISID